MSVRYLFKIVNCIIVTESNVVNISHNLKMSFTFQIILWVYEKQVQARALVDSGATILFIDSDFVRKHRLVTSHLEYSIEVTNAD